MALVHDSMRLLLACVYESSAVGKCDGMRGITEADVKFHGLCMGPKYNVRIYATTYPGAVRVSVNQYALLKTKDSVQVSHRHSDVPHPRWLKEIKLITTLIVFAHTAAALLAYHPRQQRPEWYVRPCASRGGPR